MSKGRNILIGNDAVETIQNVINVLDVLVYANDNNSHSANNGRKLASVMAIEALEYSVNELKHFNH